MSVLAKASFREVLTDGYQKGYPVGQLNVNGLEYLQAIVEVAEEERSPVILGVSEGAMKYVGLDYTVALTNVVKMKATVPVILHLDHGPNFELVMKYVRHGFDAVMFDGSHYPLAENIARKKQVVDACHAAGVDVEGELGLIGGAEDELTVNERDAALAQPYQAQQFALETNVDAFPPAIGLAHGHYKGKPQLSERLATIRELVERPLVLHGSTGIPEEDIQQEIRLGVS